MINVVECDPSIIDKVLDRNPYYEEKTTNGITQSYYVSHNYRFLQICYDNQSGQYFLTEQYVKDFSDRLPGFNYFQEEQFIFEDHHPLNIKIKKEHLKL